MKYFDFASSTPIKDEILDTYVAVSKKYFAHPEVNKDCKKLENESKKLILNQFKLNNHEVIFTSGGSEANTLSIKGYVDNFESKKHFITSSYEHSSVSQVFEEIKEDHDVTYINPKQNGVIKITDILKEIKDDTVMICIMAVNNEIGTINDIYKLSNEIKKINPKIIFMTDYVQALGKIKTQDLNNVDLITISSHKIYGPKSTGALIKRKDIKLKKQIFGGITERGGTRSLPAEVSFAKAIKMTIENEEENILKVTNNIEYLETEINKLNNIKINSTPMTNIVSISFNIDMQGESIVKYLEEKDIYISTRSACSKRLNKKSKTLELIGLTDEEQNKTCRISIGLTTTKDEIGYLVKYIKELSNNE